MYTHTIYAEKYSAMDYSYMHDSQYICLSRLTHDSGDDGDGVLRGEESEEPGSCVVEWCDVVAAQVVV